MPYTSPAAEAKALNAKLMAARYAYYVESNPIMSDQEYDALEKQLRDLVAREPKVAVMATVLTAVGSDIVGSIGTIKHREPMLSLDNAYTLADLEAWIKDHPENTTYTIEPKVDGGSLSIRYADHKLWVAVTRGDGEKGEDVTQAAMTIRDIPKTLPSHFPENLEVRGEVFMTKAQFNALNEAQFAAGKDIYKNQRNLATGSLKLKDLKEVKARGLSFQPWQVIGLEPTPGTTSPDMADPNFTEEQKLRMAGATGLEHSQALEFIHRSCGFRQPHCWRVYHKKDMAAAIGKNITLLTTLWEDALGMKCDGLVIKVEQHFLRRQLGNGTKAPKWAIAFKIQSMAGVTKLLDVVWQVGRTGALTPVGVLEPINLGGAIVQRVNLNNLSWIREKGLELGCLVEVVRSGDVIPKVLRVVPES